MPEIKTQTSNILYLKQNRRRKTPVRIRQSVCICDDVFFYDVSFSARLKYECFLLVVRNRKRRMWELLLKRGRRTFSSSIKLCVLCCELRSWSSVLRVRWMFRFELQQSERRVCMSAVRVVILVAVRCPVPLLLCPFVVLVEARWNQFISLTTKRQIAAILFLVFKFFKNKTSPVCWFCSKHNCDISLNKK